MLNRYFQEELANLRELASEFSREHPALAPMLKGPSTDPDVERLLEGVAFLAGLLREKIDDEFPEIIQGLLQLVFPHYLRPLPSTTIMAFAPKPSLKQAYTVPRGVTAASKEISGTRCLFRTCYDIEVHPLKVTDAAIEQQPGKPPSIRLSLELTALDLSTWEPEKLRFHLAQEYGEAANLHLLLMKHLKRVSIEPKQGGRGTTLTPDHVTPVGFGEDEALIPYPPQSFPGYRVLQEFFILPHKFLFFDLNGLERWKNRGDGTAFDIVFELADAPVAPPRARAEDFVLFASPAINVFPQYADPITIDHRRNEYRVSTGGARRGHYQVYSVDRVSGYAQGMVQEIEYKPFELFGTRKTEDPVYHVSFRRSPIGNTIDALVSLTYPREKSAPGQETLSMDITCTNGELADNLQSGDVSHPTSDSPELLSFRNIRPTTMSVLPPLGDTLLWRFLSLYSLNYFSIADTENLRTLLGLHIFSETRDQSAAFANMKRVEGVEAMEVADADRLVRGFVLRGKNIRLDIRSDHFASDGDLFLFGSVLDNFLSSYTSLNCFSSVSIKDALKGEVYKWPARLGNRPLI